MKTQAEAQIRARLRFLEENRSHLVIDADTHVTDLERLRGDILRRYEDSLDYYHGRPVSGEQLLAEMGLADVDMALIWQNPATTSYHSDAARNFSELLEANRYIYDLGRQHPEKFIPAGWTDPRALGLDKALELVDTLVEDFGFFIVKLNPAQNRYPLDSEPVRRVVARIVEQGAVPAFHFGADTPYTPADDLRAIARLHPDSHVLAVHMGGGGAGYVEAETLYHEARALGLEQRNIHYAFSAKRDTHMESDLIAYQLAGEAFANRLFCASDAPYGRMTWNFGGFRAMLKSLQAQDRHPDPRVKTSPGLFTDESTKGYLGRHFADFAIAGYRRLLAKHAPVPLDL